MCKSSVPPLDSMERAKIEYKEVRDHIQHFSTLRATLTTFLMTVGLTALGAYSTANGENKNAYLVVAGFIALLMSLVVCLIFSYRTEHWTKYSTELWKYFKNEISIPKGVMSDDAVKIDDVIWNIFMDVMNYVIIITLGLITWGFWAFAPIGLSEEIACGMSGLLNEILCEMFDICH